MTQRISLYDLLRIWRRRFTPLKWNRLTGVSRILSEKILRAYPAPSSGRNIRAAQAGVVVP